MKGVKGTWLDMSIKWFPQGLINWFGVCLVDFIVSFKSGKYITGDSEGFKGTFIGADELKKFLPAECNIRRNVNTLDVGIVNQFVDFSSQFYNMSFWHVKSRFVKVGMLVFK